MHVAAGWAGVFVTVFKRGVSTTSIKRVSAPVGCISAAFEKQVLRARYHEGRSARAHTRARTHTTHLSDSFPSLVNSAFVGVAAAIAMET